MSSQLIQSAKFSAGDATDPARMIRGVVDSISEGFVLYDADDRLILCNEKYREIYALSADSIVPGNSFEDILRFGAERGQYADAMGRVDEWIAERVRLHRDPAGPIEQRLGDGRWLRISENKTPSGCVAGLHIDITDVKRAEEAARRDEQRYRRLVEHANVVSYSFKIGENRLSYIGPQVLKLLGYPMDKLESGEFWHQIMHPDDRPEVIRTGALMEARKQDYTLEYRMLAADGRVIWIRDLIAFDTDPDGTSVVYGVIIDTTEQKQAEAALRESERRFHTMADTMPALLWLDDSAGKTIFFNRRWLDYTGRRLEEELGDGWHDDIHLDDRERVVSLFAQAYERHTSDVSVEYRLRGKDGQYRSFLDTATPRVTPDGELLGYIGVLVDLEDRRRLEAQLLHAQKIEAIGQLTGGIAHDFNNMLTVIMGNLDLARNRVDGDLHNTLDRALSATKKSADLVRRLLAFSRKQTLSPGTIDFNALVTGMEDLLRRTLGEDAEIEMKLCPDLWPAIADKGQVENALLNLAINSRDAMAEGGKLTIETRNVDLDVDYVARNAEVTPGQYVMLAVTDTGAGMLPEVIARACEPFFTTKEVGKGTGLGLSMIYGFAKQSGGHLKIYSEVGHGTTVSLYLPCALAKTATSVEPQTSHLDDPRGDETILVVEDDPDVRSFVTSQLQTLGYRILEAADGAEARVILWSDEWIDLLFTDVIMPGGMTGPKLTELARQHRPELTTLFTSGYTERSIIHQGKLNPGAQLLSKPYRKGDLALKVREVLDARD